MAKAKPTKTTKPRAKKATPRILVIGDTHFPFEHPDYLAFCKKVYDAYDCDRVIHSGDLVDAYGFSFYDTDPGSISLTEELARAAKSIEKWAEVFPKMTITIGNHTKRCAKRLIGSKIPKRLWPTYNEIFGAPKSWKFVENITIGGVYFTHGEEGDARKQCLINQSNTSSCHAHTKMGIEYYSSRSGNILWGIQNGTGIDHSAYAFDYARNFRPAQLGVTVMLDNGRMPIIVPFDPKRWEDQEVR